MKNTGFYSEFDDLWMIDGVRTPMVDYCSHFGDISPTDLGIKVAREIFRRSGISPHDIGSVISGNMAPGDFYQFVLPRHIGLYSGVPMEVPALNVQRICGTGFELIRQAGDQIERGYIEAALVVGTENMTRNPIASFSHRTGFKLGSPVEFKDFMWEALIDPAPGISMPQTAENLAKKYAISRAEVDEYASLSFDRALQAQKENFFDGETVDVINEEFELSGYATRRIQLPKKIDKVTADTHLRSSPVEVLAKLRPIYEGGVQTGGNSSALVDAAAAAIIGSGSYVRKNGRKPLAKIIACSVVGVPPEIMGIGPAAAIRNILQRSGLQIDDIDLFEINEAQGAQIIAVERELGIDRRRLNVNGGAIALGHPLAVTGLRLTITLARELRRAGKRFGISSACIGGGQGIAILIENPFVN